MNADSPFVWHYTVGTPLVAIARSGRLAPAATLAGPRRTGEREILWFSRNQQWDPSAAMDDRLRDAGHTLSRTVLHTRFGLYRFGLASHDLRLLPWPTITRVADMDVPDAMSMVASGLRCGAAPTDWVGTLSFIPLSDLVFQAWSGKEWLTTDLNDLVAQQA